MYFLTHYVEYPIYHPEEGGYYQAGCEAEEYYEFKTKEEAKDALTKMEIELEEYGFIINEESACLHSKYIGSGERWIIEKEYGSENVGFIPYE